MRPERSDLISPIKAFLDRGDYSLDAARRLEEELDRALEFALNDVGEELWDVLASYRPGGGDLLYDQRYLERALRTALRGLAPD